VGAIAVVTNLAAGMADQVLSHDITLAGAKLGTDNLIRLIKAYLTKHKA
jgi:purine nucleoside phosphorylase